MTQDQLAAIKARADKATAAASGEDTICGACGGDFDLRLLSDSTGYCDECAQKEVSSIPALIAEVERLRGLLKETHAAWIYDANQGDGIMEEYAVLDARIKQEFRQ